MLGGRVLTLAAAALVLEVLPLTLAHGHDDASMDMAHMDGASPSTIVTEHTVMESYFWHPEHKGLMYAHVALMILGWVIVLPVGCALSLARSRLALPVQSLFLLVNAFGLLTGFVYKHKTPDLYPGHVHNKIGWAVTWIATAWVFMGILNVYARRNHKSNATGFAGQSVSTAAMARYERLQEAQEQSEHRWSGDSGQGTERNSASLCSTPRSLSVGSVNQQFTESQQYAQHETEDDDGADVEKLGFLRNTSVDRFLSRNVPHLIVGRTLAAMRILYGVLDRVILLLGFTTVTTGAVVYGGIAHADKVFSALAHFIKGGIFFWYGLVTLGRWMGCFADFGWAWNVKPPHDVVGRWKAGVPSAEFTESFVIFLYGASNVFLEHLTAWGKAWSAQDLEHVSITIMFFGGGLLGMLIESRKVRELLNTTILIAKDQPLHAPEEAWQAPKSYRFSLNPLPGLVIMLLGIMMSGHHQVSMVSTMMHKQWGTMFVGFALARGVTYIIMYLSPPTSFLPSRPPSEVVAAFCLVSGGLVFMGSSFDTVAALEANGLDAMFVFTVTMGFTALLMAWATVVVAIKGWAIRRENPRAFLSHSAGAQA